MHIFLIIVAAVVILGGGGGTATLVRRSRAGRSPSTRKTAPPKTAPPETAVADGAVQAKSATPTIADEALIEEQVTVEQLTAGSAAADPEAAEIATPLRYRMGKTRGLFSGYIRNLRLRKAVDQQTWDDLEEALLRADVGVGTTQSLLDDLRTRVADGELESSDSVVSALRQDIRQQLESTAGTDLAFEPGETNIWLFVGVNGVGKTTTIGKLAHQQSAAGRSVLLAAGDTFRAAAGEQLETWAERSGVGIVKGAEGGDPSAIVFDAVQRAAARGNDLVLADTAGRLHTKINLVEELKKIRRVAERPPGKVAEVLLVLDATTGQNGLTQARQFLDAVGVTGVVLTKLDGTAKGGIVLAIQRDLGIPVKLVGTGEGIGDLIAFDAEEFVAALFD